jgi:hypothetical protein
MIVSFLRLLWISRFSNVPFSSLPTYRTRRRLVVGRERGMPSQSLFVLDLTLSMSSSRKPLSPELKMLSLLLLELLLLLRSALLPSKSSLFLPWYVVFWNNE